MRSSSRAVSRRSTTPAGDLVFVRGRTSPSVREEPGRRRVPASTPAGVHDPLAASRSRLHAPWHSWSSVATAGRHPSQRGHCARRASVSASIGPLVAVGAGEVGARILHRTCSLSDDAHRRGLRAHAGVVIREECESATA
jgi:hypothetical protein